MSSTPRSRWNDLLVTVLCVGTATVFALLALVASAIECLMLLDCRFNWRTVTSDYSFETITLSLIAMLGLLVAYAAISSWIRRR